MRFCEWQLHRRSKDLPGDSDEPCSNGGVFGAANVVTHGTGSRSNRKAARTETGDRLSRACRSSNEKLGLRAPCNHWCCAPLGWAATLLPRRGA
jgi:hypothetical protein